MVAGRGVTRLTVTVVVIMFELTGALTYVLPVMVSARLVCTDNADSRSVDRVARDKRRERLVRRWWYCRPDDPVQRVPFPREGGQGGGRSCFHRAK